VKVRLVAFLGYLFIRALHATLRVRHVRADNLDDALRYILAFFHENVLLALHCRWRKPTSAMISQSKDGEIAAQVLRLYGADVVRGSSTRGGQAALREILRDVREGKNIAFTPDGPLGPPRVVKEGVVYAAKVTGFPIVPFYWTAKNAKRLRSWDRMLVPKPLSKVVFLYGDPITVPRDGDVEEWRLKIEKEMNELAGEAEENFDALWAEGTR
jgi:lysophospholipid acyltransferase (LPLAT)-like uncharacterized protein